MSDQIAKTAARLRAALQSSFTSLLDSVASQEQTAKEITAAKRKRARVMPGAAPQSIVDLDSLFDLAEPRYRHGFRVRWATHYESKESRAAIRALPADRRASLFKYLLALKPYLGWADEREVAYDASIAYDPEEHTRHFQRFCEGVMMVLCETGFPVDAELATQTLDWRAVRILFARRRPGWRRLACYCVERTCPGRP